jgi:stage II sporulation protein D
VDCIPLSAWTIGCGQMPYVRVGIVLPEDGATEVHLDLPATGYRAESGAHQPQTLPGGPVVARSEGHKVVMQAGGQRVPAAEAWRLVSPEAGLGPATPCARVRGVVAGRGFHWEQRIDESLPGHLEIRQVDGQILVINELPVEAYLQGVITAEMSGTCPIDLLKAQCITARTWVLARAERKHEREGYDYCNDDCCQRYQGFAHVTPAAVRAVHETRGEVMRYRDGSLVDANYSKSCGGVVEAPEFVWGRPKNGQYAVADAPPDCKTRRFFPVTPGNLDEYFTGDWLRTCGAFCSPNVVPEAALPRYLGAVDEAGSYFRWTVEYPRERLEAILKSKYFDRVGASEAPPLARLNDLTVTRRGLSGRATRLNLHYVDGDGCTQIATIEDQYWIRHALHEKFLYSSAFVVRIDRDEDGTARTIRFIGAGWGHGAGLCQIGALGMALSGYPLRSILHHYFKGITLERVYSV